MTSTATATAERGSTGSRAAPSLPFDSRDLDEQLAAEGIDIVIASSKHNIQYLLGGYRFFFFDYSDAVGNTRYLPMFVYQAGHPERSAYVASAIETYESENGRFWVPEVKAMSRSTADSVRLAIEHIKALGGAPRRIGIERAFLPADAAAALADAFPDSEIVEAWSPLERIRAIKTPAELDLLRKASELVVNSMVAVMTSHGPGTTKNELVQALRREEVNRGLIFEYCLITAGTSLNRAPSDQRWEDGEIMSLDSGGNLGGYIGDLCRMAIHGEPDAELEDALAEIDAVQQAARKPLRDGATGTEVYEVAREVLRGCKNANSLEFVAHGMGLVPHEAPRLTYTREDMDKSLKAGMVLSIETTLAHPKRGFIKLEDTVAVTETGWEAFGDTARGWNRGGTS